MVENCDIPGYPVQEEVNARAGDHPLDRMLTIVEVEKICGIGGKTIATLIAQERFPASIPVSDRRRLWRQSDVLRWISSPLEWVNF